MWSPWSRQPYFVRVEWGQRGAAELVAGGVRTVVVVDVLSFTTCVTVAVERGTAVRPHRWDLASARDRADELDAVCAVGRSAAGPGEVGLSPASILAADPVARLVLPSPNGSAVSAGLAGAVVDALLTARPAVDVSPEAEAARAASGVVRSDPLAALTRCASGVELVQKGFADDVGVAAGLDATTVVPVLADGWFVPAA